MSNYCSNVDNAIFIDPQGHIRPCCAFDIQKMHRRYHISSGIKKYKNSKWLKSFKQELLDDKQPAACERCWYDERVGKTSKRQIDSKNIIPSTSEGYNIATISFNNICNLACPICNPFSSSRWNEENKKHGGVTIDLGNWSDNDYFLEDLASNISQTSTIVLMGGEPFIQQGLYNKKFLQLLLKNFNTSEICLEYNTNGTIFPDNETINLWKDFKNIHICVSIDDIENRFEYNRWPAKWEVVYNNLKKYQSFEKCTLCFSYTVSAFTIGYIKNFLDWMDKEGFENIVFGVVANEDEYDPDVLPYSIKEKIRADLENCTNFQAKTLSGLLTNKENSLLYKFINRIKKLDHIRSQSFLENFPELVNKEIEDLYNLSIVNN